MLEPGDTLSHGAYRIQRELGGGGFGIVYLAEDVPLQRAVAIKTLRPEIATQPHAAEDFYNEARMNAGLAHPNIIPVHFVGQETLRGRVLHYLIMEFVDGGDLQSVIESETVDLRQRMVWMRQIADGLAHAHQQRVIHRDLKLRNVFVTAGRTVKIGDFGLAKAMGTETKTVMKGLGTPAYVSPEQIEGRPTDFRSDVYSLGVLYFHLLTGRLPYDAPDATDSNAKILAICYQHVHAAVPAARSLTPAIPPALDALVRRMMAKAPDQRPQSALEVSQGLAGITLPTAEEEEDEGIRWGAVAVAAGLVAAVGLGGYGAYALWPSKQPALQTAQSSTVASPVKPVSLPTSSTSTPPAPPVNVPPKPSSPAAPTNTPAKSLDPAPASVPTNTPSKSSAPVAPIVPTNVPSKPSTPVPAPAPTNIPSKPAPSVAPANVPPAAPTNVQLTPAPKSNEVSSPKPIPTAPTTTLAPGPTSSPSSGTTPQPDKRPPVSPSSPLPPIAEPRPPAPAPPPPAVAKLDPGEIKSQLEQKLRAAKYDLSVAVSAGGVVTLTGVVENQKQLQDALRLAKELPGVVEVKSQINPRDIWR